MKLSDDDQKSLLYIERAMNVHLGSSRAFKQFAREEFVDKMILQDDCRIISIVINEVEMR